MDNKKEMKVILDKAWEKMGKKEELLEIIAKKAPHFTEEEKLAFAKIYAYTTLNKAEDNKNIKGVHKPKTYSPNVDNPRSKLGGQSEAGHRARGLKATRQAIEEHGKPKVSGALEHNKRSAVKEHHKVLEEQKKMPKPNLPKSEMSKSSHGKPGVNRPEHSRGINETVSVSGNPKAGERYSEKSLAGLKARRGDLKGAKQAVKETIEEARKMPKPNLSKSEMAKEEKGVHKPYQEGRGMGAHVKHGTSKAGFKARLGSKLNPNHQRNERGDIVNYDSDKKKQYKQKSTESAREEHKKVLDEMKNIKPSLPKSELAKSKVEQMKLDLKKKPINKSLHEKGVNSELSSVVNQGKSVRGQFARAAKDAKQKGAYNQERENKQTAARHSKENIEFNKQNKPNLPKSEKQD